METQDLLNEISKLSQYSDRQINFREGMFKYSYNELYLIWKEHWDNHIPQKDINIKYGLGPRTLSKFCKKYSLPIHKKPIYLERHNDVINGMDCATFCDKYSCTATTYYCLKHRIKKDLAEKNI